MRNSIFSRGETAECGSVAAELLIVAALGVIFVSWAALSFGKQE
jgi:hypothetical protein